MLIPFGIRESDEKIIDASDVLSGKACGCICPECESPLIARHYDGARVDHFAHYRSKVCSNSFESAVHLAAKKATEENEQIFKSETKPKKAPIDNDTNKIAFEARSLVKLLNPNQPIGVTFKFIHDLEKNEYALDVPIYLLKNQKNKLTGGVRFQWSESAGAIVGFFVNKPFNVFN